MGYLISNLFNNAGHTFDFEYSYSEQRLKCDMKCSCSWRINIEAFQESWSVIEVKVKSSKHLTEHGIESNYPIAVFTFEDYPSSSK